MFFTVSVVTSYANVYPEFEVECVETKYYRWCICIFTYYIGLSMFYGGTSSLPFLLFVVSSF